MAARIKPLPVLAGAQAQAVDPNVHAAVSASAGTGKTQVLTGRVLSLLLSGVEPETILCVTFTKAGAAEMANRIGARLAAWVRMKDNELAADLMALRADPGPATRERARRLFAKVLEAPGGLRIQTIHGFAQTLLAAFPAEADITPGFEPIEGRAEQELARATLANLLADGEARLDNGLVADVQCLSLRLGEEGAVGYLMQCAAVPEAMAALGPAESIEPRLRMLMGLPEADVADYLAEHCGDDRFDCDLLRAVADINRAWETREGAENVAKIERWLALPPAERAEGLPDLALLVFTQASERRKPRVGQVKIDPEYQSHTDVIAQSISTLIQIQNGARLAADMAAGLRAGQAFAAAYTRAKRAAGVADFNDLIAWTRRLLAAPGMGDWVRYKLDRRTDHILVDESQDTNRAQWEIVQALAAEFFAGLGAGDERSRTIFMVGDFKQAIFGFQGTDPQEFENARRWVREQSAAHRAADEDDREGRALEFRDLSIEASYRSAPAVLDVVDAVIDEVGYRNIGLPEEPKPHRAHFLDRPGLVELWKPFAGEDGEDAEEGEEGWLGEDARLYASELAKQVRRWLDEAPVLASTKRPLAAGDVLVLVRSRGELASLIVARLFEEGVPVAGIDRLHLKEPLAVKDLLAAVGFAVQPLDDLNLANLLVSPLIGWSQELLLELACDRGTSLWEALGRRAGERPEFGDARERLAGLLNMADYAPPHRFLEAILSGPIEGRRKLYARLGLAARDPIDELLASALEFEAREIASLDRFLAWFAKGEVEIKRDPSAPANAVRVMTVHGAKGLEAPIVILADATADPARLGGPARTLDFPVGETAEVPIIRPRKAERMTPFAELIAAAEARELEEHWRLLYVALTRASERLVVAGLQPRTKDGVRPDNCWHVRVERALAALGAQAVEDETWGHALRYRGAVQPGAVRPKPAPLDLPGPIVPDWAKEAAPAEERPPRPLAPSSIAQDREAAPPPSPAQRAAAARGTLIHQLLERLADVAPADRHATALRWLQRSAGVDANLSTEIAGTVCNILSHPDYAPLFGPGSLAEAPLAATLADGTVVAGSVDRLLVEPARVSVIDFKTGRVPESAAAIPASHQAQMRAYCDALRVIFPGRDVRAALLYTGGPQLFELDC
ncbi:MAG TPA: double-strand break repair helicase AddA [Sphingomicrobium sp.]|nr:double-strand break repair helicase AddA [Sphingomicrobium sp.]